jgi:hypothetical protein
MRKHTTSWAALALASAALFTALGGPAWAGGLINGSQIKNGSITSSKIGRGQIKAANLAAGAVSASKVARSSLTAADIAPNTFLGANATAANAAQLGGMPASKFVQGTGQLIQRRVEVPVGTSDQFLLDVGLGELDGSCPTSSKPEVSFTAEAQPLDLIEWGTTWPSSTDINPVHDMTIGQSYTEPDATALQTVEFQVAQSFNNPPSRVATIWTTDDGADGGTECIFIAQAVTTGV